VIGLESKFSKCKSSRLSSKTVQSYTSLSGSKTTVNVTTRICEKDIGVTKDTEQRNSIDKEFIMLSNAASRKRLVTVLLRHILLFRFSNSG